MGKFYVHDGRYLLHYGCAPDGMEKLQARPGEQVVVGELPACGTPPHPGARWHIATGKWVDTRDSERLREHKFQKFRADRYAAYPPIADQLDALWHAMDAGTLPRIEPMYSQIKAVKSRIKKPGIE